MNINRPDSAPVPLSVPFIGSLDWISYVNGLRWFLREVWPGILKETPDAVLRIAGRNSGNKKITGKNILFYGEVEDSAEFLSASPVMIIPLFFGSGIRIRIIEGMHIGRSIVTTPVAVEGMVCRNGES